MSRNGSPLARIATTGVNTYLDRPGLVAEPGLAAERSVSRRPSQNRRKELLPPARWKRTGRPGALLMLSGPFNERLPPPRRFATVAPGSG